MVTTIKNYIIEDSRLSWTAIGIYAFILSKGDGWPVDDNYILACAGPDESAVEVRAALAQLREYGYVEVGQ